MTNKRTSIVIFVFMLGLIAASSWLYVQSQVDYETHNKRMELVNQLQLQTNKLFNDILQVEGGGRNNFDQVAQTERRVEQLLAAQEVSGKESVALATEVKRFLAAVSRIKSNFAIFLNSVSYFPKSVSLLRKELIDTDDIKLLQEVNSLERQALRYSGFSANNTAKSRMIINNKIDSLERVFATRHVEIRQLASVVVRHTNVLLNHADRLHKLNEQILQNEIAALAPQVLNRYDASFKRTLEAAKDVKTGFYMSIFVLLYLTFVFWNRQRQSLRYLAENTKSLSLALKTAKQNQFSVNIKKRQVTLGKAYTKALGLGSKEHYLSIEEWEGHLHPDEKTTVVSHFHDCITTGTDFNID
ncbi:MAG: DAHL domain-containing protein [Cycloclasticus sp.]